MGTATKFPLTAFELAEMSGGAGVMHFPATAAEYWELVTQVDYRADFYQNEIIAMSYENDIHAGIATQLSFLLKQLFQHDKTVRVFNGNRPVCIPDCENAIFNPDGSIVQLPAQKFEYQPGMNAELTPLLLFEVLSKTTRHRDFGEKLPCYKKIPSLQWIIFIESERPEITFWERQETPGQWLEQALYSPEEVVVLGDKRLSLHDIYADTLL